MNQIVKELVVVHRIQYFVLGGFYPSFTTSWESITPSHITCVDVYR